MSLEAAPGLPKHRTRTPSPLKGALSGLGEPEKAALLDQLRVQLIRLGGVYPSALTPQQQIDAVMQIEVSGSPIIEVTRNTQPNRTTKVVKDARKNVHSALYFVKPNSRPDTGQLPRDESTKMEHLIRLEKQAEEIRRIVSDPAVVQALKPAPHIGYLLHAFADNATLQPVIDAYKIPLGLKGVDYVNRLAKRFLFSDSVDEGLLNLATKVLFAKWAKNGVNWYDEDPELTMIRVAQQLFSTNLSKREGYLLSMRTFWEEIIKVESAKHKATPLARDSNGTVTPLPRIARDESVSIGDSLIEYARYNTIPPTLLEFARSVVQGTPRKELAAQMFQGLGYKEHSKSLIISAGISFIERVLLTPCFGNNIGNMTGWIDALNTNKRLTVIRDIHRAIRATR